MTQDTTPAHSDWLTRLWRAFSYRDDTSLSPRHSRAVLVMAAFAPVAAVSFWGFAVFYAVYDVNNLWPAVVTCFASGLFFLVLPSRIRRDVFTGCTILLVAGSAIFSFLCYLFSAASGLNLAFFTGTILAFLLLGTSRLGRVISICGPALALGILMPFVFHEPALDGVTPDLLGHIYQSNVMALLTMTALALFLAVRQVEIAETALAAEHARSEGLLRNLLPDQIAARLKAAPGATIADDIPQMTVLFADIVDFTPRAARMAPDALVTFLNRVFSAFDDLTAQHGLEKIKTIGDAYMVAAGLPVPRPDHAEVAARMALDMIAATERLSADMDEPVAVRIGLHTGPAIAGVIGTTKVFHDVWGDTVNTASRLESHGVQGRIQVTGTTRAALAHLYTFTPRGRIDIKGLGPTETFWLSRTGD